MAVKKSSLKFAKEAAEKTVSKLMKKFKTESLQTMSTKILKFRPSSVEEKFEEVCC